MTAAVVGLGVFCAVLTGSFIMVLLRWPRPAADTSLALVRDDLPDDWTGPLQLRVGSLLDWDIQQAIYFRDQLPDIAAGILANSYRILHAS